MTPTCDCGSAARHIEFAVDARDVTLHRVARDEQLATDVAQREVALEQGQNLELTIRQRFWLGSRSIDDLGFGGEGPLDFGEVLFEDAPYRHIWAERAERAGR